MLKLNELEIKNLLINKLFIQWILKLIFLHFHIICQRIFAMDLTNLFQLYFTSLKFFGYKIRYENNWKSKLMIFWLIYCFVLTAVLFVGALIFVLFHNENMEETTETIGYLAQMTEVMVKLTLFSYKRRDLEIFIGNLKSLINQGTK